MRQKGTGGGGGKDRLTGAVPFGHEVSSTYKSYIIHLEWNITSYSSVRKFHGSCYTSITECCQVRYEIGRNDWGIFMTFKE